MGCNVAIVAYAGNLFRCLSTDTKPSATTYAAFLIVETNTGNTFTSIGGAWVISAPALVYTVLANDTLAQAKATNSVNKLTVTAARTLTTTVPPAGCGATTIILTSGTTSFVITFGAGFKPTATLATGTVTARVFVVRWISDGTNLYEASRTIAMVA